MTRARTVSSVADGGNEDRNNDIWVVYEPIERFDRNVRRTYHRFVFWRLKALLFGMPSQDFACDGVIVPEIPVLNILL